MRLAFLFFSALFLPNFLLLGQTVFSVNDPIVNNGTCTNFQNNAGGIQPTAIWIDQNLILNNIATPTAIVRDFEIFIGKPGESSEGLAVVLQQEGTAAIGGAGEAIGYGGINSSISFEIDTHIGIQDSLAGGNQHLGVHVNGQHELPSLAGGPLSLPDMFDGNYHHGVLTINWDPTNVANQSVSFTLDGTYTLTYNVELSTIFNLSNPLYIGGTSAPHAGQNNPVLASQGVPGSGGTCSTLTLPIELLAFESKLIGQGKVKLLWQTAIEQNFSHFSIERSLDQRLWQACGQVEGSGNSEQIRNYEYVDEVNGNGRYYYRLKEVDLDGKYSYSNILEVALEDLPIQFFPNPASDHIILDLANIAREHPRVQLSILGATGQVVLEKEVSTKNSFNEEIGVSSLLPGLYLIKVDGNMETIWTGRLMVK